MSIGVTAMAGASGWTCRVRIETGSRIVSEHTVEVSPSELKRLAPDTPVEELVRRAFEFLLEREPPESILRAFALSDIERYFPEFPRSIRS